MILVDTSVWIDHIRGTGKLTELLSQRQVVAHPFIIGELACGTLPNRRLTLHHLRSMPSIAPVTDATLLGFIELHNLMGCGVGYVDMHLLAAAATCQLKLHTRDKRLLRVATDLSLDYH
ncbi:MAG: PIN domain-containing protein [Pseudomonadota bacterium]